MLICLGTYFIGCLLALPVFFVRESSHFERPELVLAGDLPVARAGFMAGLRRSKTVFKIKNAETRPAAEFVSEAGLTPAKNRICQWTFWAKSCFHGYRIGSAKDG